MFLNVSFVVHIFVYILLFVLLCGIRLDDDDDDDDNEADDDDDDDDGDANQQPVYEAAQTVGKLTYRL